MNKEKYYNYIVDTLLDDVYEQNCVLGGISFPWGGVNVNKQVLRNRTYKHNSMPNLLFEFFCRYTMNLYGCSYSDCKMMWTIFYDRLIDRLDDIPVKS